MKVKLLRPVLEGTRSHPADTELEVDAERAFRLVETGCGELIDENHRAALVTLKAIRSADDAQAHQLLTSLHSAAGSQRG